MRRRGATTPLRYDVFDVPLAALARDWELFSRGRWFAKRAASRDDDDDALLLALLPAPAPATDAAPLRVFLVERAHGGASEVPNEEKRMVASRALQDSGITRARAPRRRG